jgi:uncharacterized protein (TIGR00251 family)
VSTANGVTLVVRLTPRGGRDAIEGAGPDGDLRVRVAAPPVDGAANKALLRLLAEELAVPASALRIVTGDTSRTKRVSIEGVDAADLERRWPGVRTGSR